MGPASGHDSLWPRAPSQVGGRKALGLTDEPPRHDELGPELFILSGLVRTNSAGEGVGVVPFLLIKLQRVRSPESHLGAVGLGVGVGPFLLIVLACIYHAGLRLGVVGVAVGVVPCL